MKLLVLRSIGGRSVWLTRVFSCSHMFVDDGENKLSYTAIFEEYTTIIESAIEEHLTQTVRTSNPERSATYPPNPSP
eukprot:9490049-Pyramimonas_sp.AAC.2